MYLTPTGIRSKSSIKASEGVDLFRVQFRDLVLTAAKIIGLIPHDQPVGHLVVVFARILPANSADGAVSAGCAGS
jgi:hypothetical protein